MLFSSAIVMFAYRVLMFTMIMDNIFRLIPKLILAVLYVFGCGLILIYLVEWKIKNVIDAAHDPIYTMKYLYSYIKWWVDNRQNLEFKHLINLIIALVVPYFTFSVMIKGAKLLFKLLIILGKKIFKHIIKINNKESTTPYKPVVIIKSNPKAEEQQEILRQMSLKLDELIKDKSNNK